LAPTVGIAATGFCYPGGILQLFHRRYQQIFSTSTRSASFAAANGSSRLASSQIISFALTLSNQSRGFYIQQIGSGLTPRSAEVRTVLFIGSCSLAIIRESIRQENRHTALPQPIKKVLDDSSSRDITDMLSPGNPPESPYKIYSSEIHHGTKIDLQDQDVERLHQKALPHTCGTAEGQINQHISRKSENQSGSGIALNRSEQYSKSEGNQKP
jgi:hypothetical protein